MLAGVPLEAAVVAVTAAAGAAAEARAEAGAHADASQGSPTLGELTAGGTVAGAASLRSLTGDILLTLVLGLSSSVRRSSLSFILKTS